MLICARLDVALPLAQWDLAQARSSGDMRYLRYAEAILTPWMRGPKVAPEVRVLNATMPGLEDARLDPYRRRP